MHLETLLYMLLQSDKTLPPPGNKPDFASMAQIARRQAVPSEWVTIPAREVFLGMDDRENDSGPDRYFAWDVERPSRAAGVPAFSAKARPITNEEYALYLEQTDRSRIPASWSTLNIPNGTSTASSKGVHAYMNGDGPVLSDSYLKSKSVRTVYGLVPLEHALDWPVFASYDELAGCAQWMNGRIPTVEEVRSIYEYVDEMKTKEAEKVLGKTISAVNGFVTACGTCMSLLTKLVRHLSNEGVEETPPSAASFQNGFNSRNGPEPRQLFVNLEGCNVGFNMHWHPSPVTQNGNKLAGQGDMGGVWEWTSSVLERHEGFEPMALYPAYSGKHSSHGKTAILMISSRFL